MPRAVCLIRQEPPYRAKAFEAGLRACGYEVTAAPPAAIRPDDVLISWNRYGRNDILAHRFEMAGARVLVAENGYLGREWSGQHWYAISRSQHNGAGGWHYGGPDRWDSLGVALGDWRHGSEVVILPQRGIGPPGVAMPRDWVASVRKRLKTDRPIRVREHPGERQAARTLEQDLQDAHCCVTWGSGAALKALLMGVPCFHDFPQWIGGAASSRFIGDVEHPAHPDRLSAFRSIAWAMWRVEEIENGDPFRLLLG